MTDEEKRKTANLIFNDLAWDLSKCDIYDMEKINKYESGISRDVTIDQVT